MSPCFCASAHNGLSHLCKPKTCRLKWHGALWEIVTEKARPQTKNRGSDFPLQIFADSALEKAKFHFFSS